MALKQTLREKYSVRTAALWLHFNIFFQLE